MKKVLVTGASGFLGRHLVEQLVEIGFAVRGVDLKAGDFTHKHLEWLEGSFLDAETLEGALEGCEVVFHLASTTLPKSSNDDPGFDVATNLNGTIALLDGAVAAKVGKFIFISSGGTVYGVPDEVPVSERHPTNPTCSYGIVKLAIEKYLFLYHQLHGLDTCSLRLSNPYGEYQRPDSGQGAIAAFCHKALRGDPIEIWGDGTVVRDFIYVKDAVRAMRLAMDADCGGKAINIGYGAGNSLAEVLNEIEAISGVALQLRYQPGRAFDVPAIYLDVAEADRILDWRPEVDLKSGLQHLFAWAKTQA